MKLTDLTSSRPQDNATRMFEGYFNQKLNFNNISLREANNMLRKVRSLIREHRSSNEFHMSENDPAYLKLVILEEGLSARISETSTVPIGTAVGANLTASQNNSTMPPSNPTVAAGDAAKAAARAAVKNPPANAVRTAQKDQQDLATIAAAAKSVASPQNNLKTGTVPAVSTQVPAFTRGNMGESKKETIDSAKAKSILKSVDGLGKDFHTLSSSQVDKLLSHAKTAGYKKSKSAPGSTGRMFFQHLTRLANRESVDESMKARKFSIFESEIQQAQVVLAGQDMVDETQKMLERVTAMQYKDLPALAEQIKGQIGINQAIEFNGKVNTTLSMLVQNIQSAKVGLEEAMTILTGTAPIGEPGVPEELDFSQQDDIEIEDSEEEIELPAELGGAQPKPTGGLGRERR